MSTAFRWELDLKNSRDISKKDQAGYAFVLRWFEKWRIKAGLPPGREAARQFWKAQVNTGEREPWQMEKWAEAFRWYIGWVKWCEKEGKTTTSLEERVGSAVDNTGGWFDSAGRSRFSLGHHSTELTTRVLDPKETPETLGQPRAVKFSSVST